MADINHRTAQTKGIDMHIAEAGEGPLVILRHGFPESWYSWRHQLPALAERGYHAVAPDQRGYGRTDAPRDIGAYTQFQLVVEHTWNDVSVVAGVFLTRRGREVVPGYVEWAQRGEGRTGDHPKGAPTNAHLLCCRLSTYARYAFEATPRIWTLVDALTRHSKCVRPLVGDIVGFVHAGPESQGNRHLPGYRPLDTTGEPRGHERGDAQIP